MGKMSNARHGARRSPPSRRPAAPHETEQGVCRTLYTQKTNPVKGFLYCQVKPASLCPSMSLNVRGMPCGSNLRRRDVSAPCLRQRPDPEGAQRAEPGGKRDSAGEPPPMRDLLDDDRRDELDSARRVEDRPDGRVAKIGGKQLGIVRAEVRPGH